MRGSSRIAAGLWVGAGLGLAASCQSGSFACETDQACAGLTNGLCEPSGYCSVPDEGCDSGRRYAPHSGGLSEQCVEAEQTETGSATTATETGSTSRDDGSTTEPSDTSTDATDSTGTEPPRVGCEGLLLVDEPFDALPLRRVQWGTYETTGVTLAAVDGELRLTATDATNAYSGLYTWLPLPPLGSGGVELLAVPPLDVEGEAFVVLTDPVSSYGFSVTGGALRTFSDGVDHVERTSTPHDPVAHRWLRLRFDQLGRELFWEVSPDGFDWTIVDEEYDSTEGFSFLESQLDLGAGVWGGPFSAEPLGSFGHAFVCTQ